MNVLSLFDGMGCGQGDEYQRYKLTEVKGRNKMEEHVARKINVAGPGSC